jgi:hypothetical protein
MGYGYRKYGHGLGGFRSVHSYRRFVVLLLFCFVVVPYDIQLVEGNRLEFFGRHNGNDIELWPLLEAACVLVSE